MKFSYVRTSGISLVEVIVVSAMITLVFGGLFAGTRYSLELIAHSRAKLSALSLANDRMELFRSFPYDDVGTVAGIPPGVIPQISTSTLNGIEFTERVLVEYVDDPADGSITGTSTDSNGIPSDYKRVKVEITWNIYETPGQLALVSNIVPRSIETTVGGGTVRINVINQDSQPLENASVRLVNDTTTSTIDITRFTDASGIALFSGAPAASSYEVLVTDTGYSTDQTYAATTSNPNPITSPFAVLESDISTLTFQIDQLSNISATVLSSVTFLSSDEFFTSSTGIATSTNSTVVSGALELTNTLGVYDTWGEVYLAAIAPSPLVAWEAMTMAVDTPVGTSYTVDFHTASGSSYTAIPDGDLPGNGSGFSDAIVDLSALDASMYPSIVPRITLGTVDTSETLSVDEFRVFYRSAEIAASGRSVDVQGTKTIGTELDSSPIYKYTTTALTNVSGEVNLTDVEFDNYQLSVQGSYDVAYSCPSLPLAHRGGVDSDIEMQIVANTANSLQVRVSDDSGNTVPGASVLLEHSSSSYSGTVETNPCGVSFFSGLIAQSNYMITVSKPGYSDTIVDPYDISNDASTLVILNAS